jgi:hypothetical protein
MEAIGYLILALAAIAWFCVILFGLVAAFPWGLIGLVAIVGVGFLLLKVLVERIDNEEDNYYEKNVDK